MSEPVNGGYVIYPKPTDAQVNGILLTFVGTTAFCLLALLTPDRALLGGNEKINVPFTGPVSFFGFMLLAPTVLILLRVYLQIYVEWDDEILQIPAAPAPTLVPLKNPLIRLFNGFAFYLLLPVAMLLFAWKAAVFPEWGAGLLCVGIGVIASHEMLLLGKVSWPAKAWVSVIAAILAAVVILDFKTVRRPFNLRLADLSGQYLSKGDFMNANLDSANLTGAHLIHADLRCAILRGAHLIRTNLRDADLSGTGAKLPPSLILNPCPSTHQQPTIWSQS